MTDNPMAILSYPGSDPEPVQVAGPYTVKGSMPDEWVVIRADGSTMAVQGRHLTLGRMS